MSARACQDTKKSLRAVNVEAAHKEYGSRNDRSQTRAAIPDAWLELVEKGSEVQHVEGSRTRTELHQQWYRMQSLPVACLREPIPSCEVH